VISVSSRRSQHGFNEVMQRIQYAQFVDDNVFDDSMECRRVVQLHELTAFHGETV
jgi:hypothetical protein